AQKGGPPPPDSRANEKRRHEGDRGARPPAAGRYAEVGAPRVPRLPHERLALRSDAFLHGSREPLPDLRLDSAIGGLSAVCVRRGAAWPPFPFRCVSGPVRGSRESRAPASCP